MGEEDENKEMSESDTNEDEFYKQFMKEVKKKDMLEKLKLENNQIIFNDEDDKFIMDFEKDEEEAESFLDKEKRKQSQTHLLLVNRKNLFSNL